MSKVALFLIVIATLAIVISRKMRLSSRYERSDSKVRTLSPWNSLDRGIDPTVESDQ